MGLTAKKNIRHSVPLNLNAQIRRMKLPEADFTTGIDGIGPGPYLAAGGAPPLSAADWVRGDPLLKKFCFFIW